jgi:hypothetical protein
MVAVFFLLSICLNDVFVGQFMERRAHQRGLAVEVLGVDKKTASRV